MSLVRIFILQLNEEQSKGKGFLQWLFPSWGGWYSDASDMKGYDVPAENEVDSGNSTSEVKELKSQLGMCIIYQYSYNIIFILYCIVHSHNLVLYWHK